MSSDLPLVVVVDVFPLADEDEPIGMAGQAQVSFFAYMMQHNCSANAMYASVCRNLVTTMHCYSLQLASLLTPPCWLDEHFTTSLAQQDKAHKLLLEPWWVD